MEAIGILESNSIAKGIEAADAILKAADTSLLFSKPVCPGKYTTLFYGDVAVSGALTVNGQTVEAMLFPVGSVRLTDSPAAPETPAGAAWESVETGIAGVYGWRRTT